MSQQEVVIGKLKPYYKTFDGLTQEQIILEFCKENSLPIDESDVLESWHNVYYEKYVICGNSVYEIIKKTEFDDGDIFEAHTNKQGEVEFVLSYYNGGCSFQEALEYALQKMNKKS